MNVIVVGAGKVGYTVAERLSRDESNNVMVIEDDPLAADKVGKSLNITLYKDTGSNPRVLREAIGTHNPDVIISTVTRDEDNLFICMMAKRFNPEIRTIASITNPDYMIATTDQGFVGVDVIVSPEIITAEKMYYLAVVENLVDFEYMGSDLELCLAIFSVNTKIFD